MIADKERHSPERCLWIAVLGQAVEDLSLWKKIKYSDEQRVLDFLDAVSFFKNKRHASICDSIDVSSEYVASKIKSVYKTALSKVKAVKALPLQPKANKKKSLTNKEE